MSAAGLLAECSRIADAGATWPEIASALNPQADTEVEALLSRLRAAHDGAPLAMLEAITNAARAALQDNPEASAFDAFVAATRHSPWTSSAKW